MPTVSSDRTGPQTQHKTRAIPWLLERSSRLISGAMAKIGVAAKSGQEFLICEDISNGREANKIPAWSYKRNDNPPADFHYVTEHVQSEPVPVDMSLSNMSHCKCLADCSDGSCYCASKHRGGACYDSKGRLRASYNVDTPEPIHECNSGCACNRKLCRNTVIQHGSQVKVSLIRTKSRGWGVRSDEHLKRGTFVGVYSGELITASGSTQREDDTYLFNLTGNDIPQSIDNADNHYVCDAKFYGNFTRFINHSCDANIIGIRSFTVHHDRRFPYIAFFTNQDIPERTELTLNYGDNYWLVKVKRDGVYCLCRKAGCKFTRKSFDRTIRRYNRSLRAKQQPQPIIDEDENGQQEVEVVE